MRKCTGNNTREWGFDAIFDIECPKCGNLVEFFKDEITRNCQQCKKSVLNAITYSLGKIITNQGVLLILEYNPCHWSRPVFALRASPRHSAVKMAVLPKGHTRL
jgi:hypothetical protein